MQDRDTRACTRVAARPEPVCDFTTNMLDEEVESPRAAAVEPVPQKMSWEGMQNSTQICFRKEYEYEWNEVSQFF